MMAFLHTAPTMGQYEHGSSRRLPSHSRWSSIPPSPSIFTPTSLASPSPSPQDSPLRRYSSHQWSFPDTPSALSERLSPIKWRRRYSGHDLSVALAERLAAKR